MTRVSGRRIDALAKIARAVAASVEASAPPTPEVITCRCRLQPPAVRTYGGARYCVACGWPVHPPRIGVTP